MRSGIVCEPGDTKKSSSLGPTAVFCPFASFLTSSISYGMAMSATKVLCLASLVHTSLNFSSSLFLHSTFNPEGVKMLIVSC